jgi:hypothetical protein
MRLPILFSPILLFSSSNPTHYQTKTKTPQTRHGGEMLHLQHRPRPDRVRRHLLSRPHQAPGTCFVRACYSVHTVCVWMCVCVCVDVSGRYYININDNATTPHTTNKPLQFTQLTQHTKTQHNMWSYFWFRVYLHGKDPLSFTGPEHYSFQVNELYLLGWLVAGSAVGRFASAQTRTTNPLFVHIRT